MELTVEERLTGREFRDRILESYGSREALEEAAGEESSFEAQDDLLTLDLLEEDPSRLDETVEVETVARLDPGDLQRLTEKRVELLDAVFEAEGDVNVTELAQRVSRDPKNVSEDLDLLAELGLVHRVRRGREKLVRPQGREIRLLLGA